MRAIGRAECALAALLLAAHPNRFGQAVLDRDLEVGNVIGRPGDQQRMADPAALADQPGRVDVLEAHQDGRRQRREPDRLVRTIGQHCTDRQLGIADAERVADVGIEPREQRALDPGRACGRHAVDDAFGAEQPVGNPHRAAQRIPGADDLDRRQGAHVAGKHDRWKRHRLGGRQLVLAGALAPLVRDTFLRAQPEVGREHFVGLALDGAADAVRQETDGRQCRDGETDGGKQHEYLAGAKLATETA